MLENFTDEEIAEELLATGELFPSDPANDKRIERNARFVNGFVSGHVVTYIYERASSCDRRRQDYRSLKELLLCECMTFDDLRKDWRYHGVLLDSPQFCERLVHDKQCWCRKCKQTLLHSVSAKEMQ